MSSNNNPKKDNNSSKSKSQGNSTEQEPLSPEASAKITKRMSNRERVRAFLSLFKREDHVLINIVADPDAMASALAIKRLLARRVDEIVIAHVNEIKRVNNLAMINLLKIPLNRFRTFKRDKFTKFVLIDSQPSHNPELARFQYDAVIDHHPITDGWDAPFVDIRNDYGATASMITEYLRAANIKPSVALSTALFYAIKTDTQNFAKKATAQDVFCFQYLFKRINQNLLRRIETADVRKSELKYFKAAFDAIKISKNRIYAHLGKVGNPDILVVVADFFTHVHDIGWVIISGIYGEKLVVIFRCDGYRKDAGKLAQRLFGDVGSAGGHRQSARAEVPLKNLPPHLLKNFCTRTLQRLIKKHLA